MKKEYFGAWIISPCPLSHHWDSQLWRNAHTELLQGHQPGLSRVTWASRKHSHHYSTLLLVCSQDLGENRTHAMLSLATTWWQQGKGLLQEEPHTRVQVLTREQLLSEVKSCMRESHLRNEACVTAGTLQTAQSSSALKRGNLKAAIPLPSPGAPPPETESLKSHPSSYPAEGASPSITSSPDFRDMPASFIYQNQVPQCYRPIETVQKIHPKEILSC